MLARLFVYGTLRGNFTNRHARMLAREATPAGVARVRGRLYRLNGYPAMRHSQDPVWVTGEVYLLRNARGLLEALDGYEGREYRRVVVAAELSRGRGVRAWCYEYRWALPAWRWIASGDWVEELAGACRVTRRASR